MATAVVSFILLTQTFFELFAKPLEIPRLERGPLLLGKRRWSHGVAQPLEDLVDEVERRIHPVEERCESKVIPIEVRLAMHEQRATKVIEPIHARARVAER